MHFFLSSSVISYFGRISSICSKGALWVLLYYYTMRAWYNSHFVSYDDDMRQDDFEGAGKTPWGEL